VSGTTALTPASRDLSAGCT